MAAKIYTKTGDQGKTSIFGGQKLSKTDLRIQAYGTIDELNSFLGWLIVSVQDHKALHSFYLDLTLIQHWLFDVGGLLASEPETWKKYQLPQISLKQVEWFEQKIDQVMLELAPQKEFILPGGSEIASRLHIARTVARRAEVCVLEFGQSAGAEFLPENILPFMNRVSDYFFAMARWCNYKLGVADVTWKKSNLSP